MAIRGEIYSKGSFGVSVAFKLQKKRYGYNGNLNIKFNQQNGGETEADSSVQKDFWIQWSHRPKSKGTGRFSASVKLLDHQIIIITTLSRCSAASSSTV